MVKEEVEKAAQDANSEGDLAERMVSQTSFTVCSNLSFHKMKMLADVELFVLGLSVQLYQWSTLCWKFFLAV